jgi:glycosyltransferase involved in cell wall biosynthesis
MNLLVLCSWYPNSKNSISGVFILEQVKALSCVGIKPVVFYPLDKTIEEGKIQLAFEDGIKTYRANTYFLKNSKISEMNSVRLTLKYLKIIIKENSIQLIHSHVCYPAGFIAAISKKLNYIPYVITEHMSYIASYAKKPYNWILFKYAYKNAEKVITVSKFLQKELQELGFIFNGEVIGNLVNLSDYSICQRDRRKNEFNILFIGLMDKTEIKGLQFFIPALAEYIKNNTQFDIRFNLAGDGVKRKSYENMCQELGIADNCHFYGGVDKSTIPEILKDNDFLVLPSLKETFGSVLIEAMAGGKPVLATNCGGPNEFVNENVGILVERGSIEALKNGIDSMINKYDEFHPEYIRNYVMNNYSYEAVGNKLKTIYNYILRNDGEK